MVNAYHSKTADLRPGRQKGSRVKFFSFLALGLLVGSCQDPTLPSSIPPAPDVLTIVPPVEGLKLGSTQMLTAVLVSGDRTRRTVPASWSSDAPEIATVSDDGRVRGISLGKATIRATFEALSALQQLRVVPDYEGAWSGKYCITNCTRLSGDGPSYCRFVVGCNSPVPLRITLTQNGSSVAGALEFYDNVNHLLEAGAVDGWIDDAGALALTGTTRSVEPVHPSETTLSDWSTALTNDGSQMTGRFVRNLSFQNFWGPQKSREECKIVTLERSRPPT
jgi:hypothetical protein